MKATLNLIILRRIKNSLASTATGRYLLYRFWRAKYGRKCPANLKLHLGCGSQKKAGFINIDHRATPATDMVCDIIHLPYPENSIDRIETYHVIEHIPHPQIPDMLREWHRILQPGGALIIECPNFDEAVREYLDGNEFRIFNIFGLQRFRGDAHLFGYNFKRIEKILREAGFKEIQQTEPLDYHKNEEPCIRIESVKDTLINSKIEK